MSDTPRYMTPEAMAAFREAQERAGTLPELRNAPTADLSGFFGMLPGGQLSGPILTELQRKYLPLGVTETGNPDFYGPIAAATSYVPGIDPRNRAIRAQRMADELRSLDEIAIGAEDFTGALSNIGRGAGGFRDYATAALSVLPLDGVGRAIGRRVLGVPVVGEGLQRIGRWLSHFDPLADNADDVIEAAFREGATADEIMQLSQEVGTPAEWDSVVNAVAAREAGARYEPGAAVQRARQAAPRLLAARRELAATAPRISEEVYLPPADAADQALAGDAARAITEFVGHGPATPERPNFGAGVMQPARLESAVRERSGLLSDLLRGVDPVRERLAREIPSGTVPLFRHQGPTTYTGETPSPRSVLSWTAQPEVAYYMGGIRPEDYPLPFSARELAAAANPENLQQFAVGPYRFERNADYPEYYDFYKNGEYQTDTEDPVRLLRDENDYIQRLNAKRRAQAANILHANVPLEDIVWVTNRAGQHEFIVRNRPDAPQYVDEFGVFGPKYKKGGRVHHRSLSAKR